MSNAGMLRHEPCDIVVLDRQHDRRLVEARRPASTRRCRSRRGASPRRPRRARCARRCRGRSRSTACASARRSPLLRPGAACSLRSAAPPARALRRPSPRRDASSSRVAMSGVLMRPAALIRGASTKPTWKPSSVLPSRPAGFEQRLQADRVRALRQPLETQLGDDAVLADQRHDVGDRADRGNLDERRQPLLAAGAARRAPAPA